MKLNGVKLPWIRLWPGNQLALSVPVMPVFTEWPGCFTNWLKPKMPILQLKLFLELLPPLLPDRSLELR